MTDIKLANMSGKYMTLDDKTKNIKLKSKNKSQSQLLSYSTQGELIIKNKCVTRPSIAGDPLYLSDCVGNELQKWKMSDNLIRAEDKCISYDENDTILTESCDVSSNQQWQTEHADSSDDSVEWSDYFGKAVVLVEADDPWYLNKVTTIPIKHNNFENPINKDDLNYRSHADFKSTRIIDPNAHDLGLGYSYRDHIGQPCIETFNEGDSNDYTNLIMTLFCIIILIFVCKYVFSHYRK